MLSCNINKSPIQSVPTRSVLYNIEPIGLGTPYVESLTSYIIRLASCHNVKVNDLVNNLVKPEIYDLSISSENILENPKNLNGLTFRTKGVVKAIQNLTSRNNLSFLTLLSLENIFSTTDAFLRSDSFWCPLCFDDWFSKGKILYEPLLWKIKFTKTCDRHLISLQNKCPHCNKKHKVLNRRIEPGFCPNCHSFLGISATYTLNKKEDQNNILISRVLGELLGRLPEIEESKLEIDINKSAFLLIQSISDGNVQVSSRIFGINESTLRQWKNNRAKPTFELILILCTNLEITITQFLLLEVPLNKIIKARNRAKSKSYTSTYIKVSRKKLNKREMEQSLTNIMLSDEYPPPSLTEVGKRLGRHHSHIKRIYPEQSKQITTKYKEHISTVHQQKFIEVSEEVRDITIKLHTKGIYPSTGQLKKYMSKPGYMKNPKIIEIYKQILNELGNER